MNALQRLGLSAALLACFGLGAQPVEATDAALVFSGTAHVNCFGCGSSTGTAELCLTGAYGTTTFAACAYPRFRGTRQLSGGAPAYAEYTVQEDPGVSCVITGSADGKVYSPTKATATITVTFHWLRVGALAVITTGGDITGSGVAAFAVTSPALPSIPCGGPVDADIAGSIAGV
jgi:hypothetical protein